MKRLIAAIVVPCMLSACAVAPVAQQDYSLIDPQDVDQQQYQKDYADCAALANQTHPENNAAAGAAGGAVAGAVFGAVLGALLCGRSCAQQGAALGAVSVGTQAAAAGATGGVVEQQRALRLCLAGRGYRVIR